MTDYEKYRGNCKEFCDKLIESTPTLRLVRGHYHCPYWGKQAHWWCEDADGEIVDPTVKQFPSNGMGEYVEFDGTCTCSECGNQGAEDVFQFESNYCFCSNNCHLRFVGLGE